MGRHEITVECPVFDSFRVQQAAGMFDVPLAEKSVERFEVELPERDEAWDVGLIVGPSGSGKSTVAERFFGDCLYRGGQQTNQWPADRAVVDSFGQTPLRQVIELLTAVGFSSPPAWVKPYQVLSCGERFRCDLARALSGKPEGDEKKEEGTDEHGEPFASAPPPSPFPVVAFDEYTSVVDRNVARACSAAIAKGIRAGNVRCRFVAVTCHYDVAEWLEADWVLDMATRRLARRRLRRPAIDVEIYRTGLAAWPLFARHHYLSGKLAAGARCYLATWNGEPATFCATLPMLGMHGRRRFTRIVTLPDYQGMGIGMRVVAAVAELHRAEGLRINLTSSHPAVIRHCRRSAAWKAVNVMKTGAASRRGAGRFAAYRSSAGRSVVSFEFVGE